MKKTKTDALSAETGAAPFPFQAAGVPKEPVAEAEMSKILETLWDKLPTHRRRIAKTRNGEEIWGTYIKVPDLLRRLQEVFGLGYSISFEGKILETENEGLYVATATVSVHHPTAGSMTVSDFGTAPLYINGRLNEHAPKAAATDAFKRAVRWLGIGMFQYENEEPEILRNTEGETQSTSSSKTQTRRKTERNTSAEFAELLADNPERVNQALEVIFNVGLGDPYNEDDEEVFVRLCNKYGVSAKQLVWLFKDVKTAERWLEAHEQGVSPREFLDTVFTSQRTR